MIPAIASSRWVFSAAAAAAEAVRYPSTALLSSIHTFAPPTIRSNAAWILTSAASSFFVSSSPDAPSIAKPLTSRMTAFVDASRPSLICIRPCMMRNWAFSHCVVSRSTCLALAIAARVRAISSRASCLMASIFFLLSAALMILSSSLTCFSVMSLALAAAFSFSRLVARCASRCDSRNRRKMRSFS